MVCRGLGDLFETPGKVEEVYVVREEPRRMSARVGVRNECIRFLDIRDARTRLDKVSIEVKRSKLHSSLANETRFI